MLELRARLVEDERRAAEHAAQLATASLDKSALQQQVVRQQEELSGLKQCVQALILQRAPAYI